MRFSFSTLTLFFVAFVYTTDQQSALSSLSTVLHSQLQSIEQCYSNLKAKYDECLPFSNVKKWISDKYSKHREMSIDIYNRYSVDLYNKAATSLKGFVQKIKEITMKGRKNLEEAINKKDKKKKEEERNKVL